ncbi:MAG: DUF3392 family protein [Deltaproteobacteria bacterium]|nr:DUF3392 family protein [Deltaproteobacteria bacterium]
MTVPEFWTLPFWNHLARAHLSELVMVLTAAVVVLTDRYVRQLVNKFTSSHGAVFRFFVFLLVCSAGYTCMALGASWLLRSGLTWKGGMYMAPIALGVLLIVAIEAQRQRQT